jgi:hypothetical protein
MVMRVLRGAKRDLHLARAAKKPNSTTSEINVLDLEPVSTSKFAYTFRDKSECTLTLLHKGGPVAQQPQPRKIRVSANAAASVRLWTQIHGDAHRRSVIGHGLASYRCGPQRIAKPDVAFRHY